MSGPYDYKQHLKDVLALEGNNTCADCHQREPEWASTNLGVFLCIKCSGVHRGLGVTVSKVKSLRLDTWDQETIKNMEEMGNIKINKEYEKLLPKKFVRPDIEFDPLSFVAHFIRQKWETKLWAGKGVEGSKYKEGEPSEDLLDIITSSKSGWLTTKRKKGGKKRLWAVLNQNALAFFPKPEDIKQPVEVISIDNCVLDVVRDEKDQVEASKLSFNLQIHAMGDSSKVVETVLVTSGTSADLVEWVQAMRFAKNRYSSDKETRTMSHGFLDDIRKEGYLVKQGGKHKTWKRRLFVLFNRYCCYYRLPTDPQPTGTIYVDDCICEVAPTPKHAGAFAFYITTTPRRYFIECETQEERAEWMAAIREAKAEYFVKVDTLKQAFLVLKLEVPFVFSEPREEPIDPPLEPAAAAAPAGQDETAVKREEPVQESVKQEEPVLAEQPVEEKVEVAQEEPVQEVQPNAGEVAGNDAGGGGAAESSDQVDDAFESPL